MDNSFEGAENIDPHVINRNIPKDEDELGDQVNQTTVAPTAATNQSLNQFANLNKFKPNVTTIHEQDTIMNDSRVNSDFDNILKPKNTLGIPKVNNTKQATKTDTSYLNLDGLAANDNDEFNDTGFQYDETIIRENNSEHQSSEKY